MKGKSSVFFFFFFERQEGKLSVEIDYGKTLSMLCVLVTTL